MNAGLQRVTTILKRTTSSGRNEDLIRIVRDAGEILRLLANIVEPFRNDGNLPELAPAVQDEFASALFAKFSDLSDILSSCNESSSELSISEATNTAIFLARLLQFNLGFPGAWTNHTKAMSTPFFPKLTRLILVSFACFAWQSSNRLNCVSFMVLVQHSILWHFPFSLIPSIILLTVCSE